jgi:hypothetical protein
LFRCPSMLIRTTTDAFRSDLGAERAEPDEGHRNDSVLPADG